MVLRPTVIGSGEPADAPRDGQAPGAAPLRPTSMGTAAIPADAPRPAPATVTALPAGSAPSPAAAAAAVITPAPSKPVQVPHAVSRLPGTQRQGMAIDPQALRARHPGVPQAALEAAASALAGIVPAQLDRWAVERLGRDAQEEASRLVDQALKLVDDEAPRSALRHVERLLSLLDEFAERLVGRPSPLVWLRRNAKTLRQAVAEVRPEIDALREQLDHAEDRVVGLRDGLVRQTHGIQAATDALTGAVIALGEIRPLAAGLAHPPDLDGREVELLRSVALLQQHRLHLRRTEQDFSRLAQRIRDAVLLALPAWLSAVAGVSDPDLDDTRRFMLLEQLHAVVNGLRSTPPA